MAETFPVNHSARTRLREAQKAEADALRDVITAQSARDRAQARLDEADTRLSAAQVGLVETSGFDRAALLLGEPVKALREKARAVAAQSRPQSRVPSTHANGAHRV